MSNVVELFPTATESTPETLSPATATATAAAREDGRAFKFLGVFDGWKGRGKSRRRAYTPRALPRDCLVYWECPNGCHFDASYAQVMDRGAAVHTCSTPPSRWTHQPRLHLVARFDEVGNLLTDRCTGDDCVLDHADDLNEQDGTGHLPPVYLDARVEQPSPA